ncbi:helix-turn-helix transcriptional regulator [Sphingosinithalassobacter tenebrarum]|uniref:Helix-turn-helix transcriptional regulator n=1 Tax=Stakelama tenebrarum TaxID=2711215 RepID=A0A6G6YAU9_9SPHN|nr:helix-turn-helix transcriptional regulator [Sphingosinithalassobacter tenebrarum]
MVTAAHIPIDLYRAVVFPNRMRELRRSRGYPKLLPLSASIPDIPYIRLSKIERGEVIARAEELRAIGAALGVAPVELLIDIGAPDFDIARWAEPFRDSSDVDLAEERFAVLLGAAVRALRSQDAALTIAAIERDHGLPPVNLSRLENAQKTFPRWNAAVRQALYSLFGVRDEAALRARVVDRYERGELDDFLADVSSSEERLARSRERIAQLREAVTDGSALGGTRPDRTAPPRPAPPPAAAPPAAAVAGIPVYSGNLPGGLIAPERTSERASTPTAVGPDAFAVRTTRAVLGPGLPVHTLLVADPARSPAPGGIVLLREEAGWRLLAVESNRDGGMTGFSLNPDYEIALDDCDPARLAPVVSATFQ